MQIGDRLKDIRKALGYDQKEMSRLFGLGDTTWQRLELEDRAPKGEILARLVEMGFSTDWLLTGIGQMRRSDEGKSTAEQPVKPMPTDARLIGRLTEKIMMLYKEMGMGIALHQAAELAAREHDRIVAVIEDPDDRLIQIGVVLAALRQELQAKAADPASSKHRA